MCDWCARTFKSSADLKRHIERIHHNKYPFHCSKCGHGLKNQAWLKVGLRSPHAGMLCLHVFTAYLHLFRNTAATGSERCACRECAGSRRTNQRRQSASREREVARAVEPATFVTSLQPAAESQCQQ